MYQISIKSWNINMYHQWIILLGQVSEDVGHKFCEPIIVTPNVIILIATKILYPCWNIYPSFIFLPNTVLHQVHVRKIIYFEKEKIIIYTYFRNNIILGRLYFVFLCFTFILSYLLFVVVHNNFDSLFGYYIYVDVSDHINNSLFVIVGMK